MRQRREVHSGVVSEMVRRFGVELMRTVFFSAFLSFFVERQHVRVTVGKKQFGTKYEHILIGANVFLFERKKGQWLTSSCHAFNIIFFFGDGQPG